MKNVATRRQFALANRTHAEYRRKEIIKIKYIICLSLDDCRSYNNADHTTVLYSAFDDFKCSASDNNHYQRKFF